MARFLKNLSQLLSSKGMFVAYCQWLYSITLQNNPPKLKLTDKISIGEWISFSEYWSFHNGITKAEKGFIIKSLPSNSEKKVAIDIEANIGLFTAYLTTFPSTSVHSFEPVPQTFSRLEKNMENNGLKDKAVLNLLAVGDNQGSIKFAICNDSPATNKISISESDHDIEVIVTTLDKYCEENHIDYVDFLKIDVEGMETQVLQGGRNMLNEKKIKSILIEVCPPNLNATGNSIEDLYESIINIGYAPYRLSSTYTIANKLTLEDLQEIVLENVALFPTKINLSSDA